MKFNELRYTRKNNVGNYSTEEIGISVVLEEGDKPSELFPKLKQFVTDRLEKQAPVVAAPVAPAVPVQQSVVAPAPATSKPQSAPVSKLNQQLVNQQLAQAAKLSGIETQF